MNSWARFYRGGRLAMALLLGVALISSTAWAAQTTKTLHDGNGSPFTIDVQTDGTNIWWIHSVCDPTTVTQCVAVNSAGQMTVLIGAGQTVGATQSGAWTLTVNGAIVSTANPLPVAGTVGLATNQMVQIQVNSAPVSAAAPMPIAGDLGGFTGAPLPVTPVVTSYGGVGGNAYTTGMTIGPVIPFTGLVSARSGAPMSGQIEKALVLFQDTQVTNMDLLLFNNAPSASTIADHTALAIAFGDFSKLIGTIHISDCTSLGTATLCQGFQPLKFVLPSANTAQTVYGVLVLRNTIALQLTGASDVQVSLAGSQD